MTAVERYEPSSLVAVEEQCSSIEAWAEQCDSVPELRDATNKLAAIDEYLNRTSTEGRARVAAAMRRLEARIGVLLGPPMSMQEAGALKGVDRDEELPLNDDQRVQFRKMAEYPEVVEEVIAESSDQAPASRRKVMERIREAKARNPVDERVARARQMAAEGYTSRQIGEAIGIANMADFRKRHGVDVPADAVVGRPTRHDSNRIVRETVGALEGVVMGLNLVDFDDLDPTLLEEWADSFSNSVRSLNRFLKQLKETAPND